MEMAHDVHSSYFSRKEFSSLCAKMSHKSTGRIASMNNFGNQTLIQVKLWSNSRISRIRAWTSYEVSIRRLNCQKLHLIPVGKCFATLINSRFRTENPGDGRQFDLPAAFQHNFCKLLQEAQFAAISGLIICALLGVQSADAVDTIKTCACLLKECRLELAKCISNPFCAANIACLQTCNDRPDETECQIKCGDLFENSVVDEFNECAVSRKKCVPRKSDVGEFPVPSSSALVMSFNISDFNGKWYITRGLNPTFDTFDCQLHEFHVDSGKLIGNISWRIRTLDGGFFTRSTVQRFVQDPSQPGVLYNHDNEYLHYQDDWYILSSKVENKPDDYIFIYYRGRNDAWDGYGGAVVYTRSPTLPETIIPELENAAKNVGRDFAEFITTDNTCGPESPLVERLEKTVVEGEKTIIKEVEQIENEVENVGRTELTVIEKLAEGFGEVKRDAENFFRGLGREEIELLNDLKMEVTELEKVFGKSLPLRKLR